MAENKGLLTLIKNKLSEAEMKQGCTDQTPYAQELIKEFLTKIREVVEGAELPKYADFITQCGSRPKDIIYNVACIDARQAILKAIDKEV